METTFLIIIAVMLTIAIALVIVFRKKGNDGLPQLQVEVDELQSGLTRIEANFKDDFRINREENIANAKTNREELNKAIGDFRTEIMSAVKAMTEQNNAALEKLNQTLEQKVSVLIEKNEKVSKRLQRLIPHSLIKLKRKWRTI